MVQSDSLLKFVINDIPFPSENAEKLIMDK